MSLNNALKKKQLHFQFFLLLTIKLNYLHDLKSRAEGGAKIFGVFRVKNHDFTQKNHIFPILGVYARNFWGIS
jgi:hypothetical protein